MFGYRAALYKRSSFPAKLFPFGGKLDFENLLDFYVVK